MTDSQKMAKLAYDALQDKKGIDVQVLDISGVSTISDFFILASGDNERQVEALSDNVDEVLYRAGFEKRAVEGYGSASWILMDYNDIVVHIFNHEDRMFYNLERIWRDAKRVDPKDFE